MWQITSFQMILRFFDFRQATSLFKDYYLFEIQVAR